MLFRRQELTCGQGHEGCQSSDVKCAITTNERMVVRSSNLTKISCLFSGVAMDCAACAKHRGPRAWIEGPSRAELRFLNNVNNFTVIALVTQYAKSLSYLRYFILCRLVIVHRSCASPPTLRLHMLIFGWLYQWLQLHANDSSQTHQKLSPNHDVAGATKWLGWTLYWKWARQRTWRISVYQTL